MQDVRDEAFRLVRRSASVLQQRMRGGLASTGLTASRYGVLETLYHHGSLSQRELAEAIGRTPGDLSLVVANLVRDELVERQRSTSDRRAFVVSLTPEGTAVTAKALASQQALVHEIFSDFDEDELARFVRVCARLAGEKSPVEAPDACAVQERLLRASDREYADVGKYRRYSVAGIPASQSCNAMSGRLRLFADDVIQPDQRLPTRPLEDVEVVEIVLSGELAFGDGTGDWQSAGECEVIGLTAGSGVHWAEFNALSEPLRVIRLEFDSEVAGLDSASDVACHSPGDRRNRLLAVASGKGDRDALRINVPVVVCLSALDPGRMVRLDADRGNVALVYVLEGAVEAGRHTLESGDSLTMPLGNSGLEIVAREAAELVVVAMNE